MFKSTATGLQQHNKPNSPTRSTATATTVNMTTWKSCQMHRTTLFSLSRLVPRWLSTHSLLLPNYVLNSSYNPLDETESASLALLKGCKVQHHQVHLLSSTASGWFNKVKTSQQLASAQQRKTVIRITLRLHNKRQTHTQRQGSSSSFYHFNSLS